MSEPCVAFEREELEAEVEIAAKTARIDVGSYDKRIVVVSY